MYLKYKNSIVKLENEKPVMDKRFWFEHILWILKPMVVYLLLMYGYKTFWRLGSSSGLFGKDLNENILGSIGMISNDSFSRDSLNYLFIGYLFLVFKRFVTGSSLGKAFIPQHIFTSSWFKATLIGSLCVVAFLLFSTLLSSDQFLFFFALLAFVFFFKSFERLVFFLLVICCFKNYENDEDETIVIDPETNEVYILERTESTDPGSKRSGAKKKVIGLIISMLSPSERIYTMSEVKSVIKNEKCDVSHFEEINKRYLIGISPNNKIENGFFKLDARRKKIFD